MRETSSSSHANPVPLWPYLPQHGSCRQNFLGAKKMQAAASAFGTCVTAQTARRVNIEADVLPHPRSQKTMNLPTACLFICNMLRQGSDSSRESSHINLSFSNGRTALLQKAAPENRFQRMNVMICVDESLCQQGHDDATSQPRERP